MVTGDSEPVEVSGSSEGSTENLAEDTTLGISEQIEVTAAEEVASQDIHIEDGTS